MDAAGGEGIGERAHHRLLADQVLEAGGAVFARQHAIAGVARCAARAARPSASVGSAGGADSGAFTSLMRQGLGFAGPAPLGPSAGHRRGG